MRKDIDYKVTCSTGSGCNPLISTEWEADLGVDLDGVRWFAKIKWLRNTSAPHHGVDDFLILFDNELEGYLDMVDEDDGGRYNSFTFHRNIDYRNYWRSLIEVFHGEYTVYRNVDSVVQKFIAEHNIK